MPTGTIKYLDRGGAWGFISRDDKQPKVFVHVRAAERAGFTELRRGQRWRFTLVEHFDVAAQWNGRHRKLGAMAINC